MSGGRRSKKKWHAGLHHMESGRGQPEKVSKSASLLQIILYIDFTFLFLHNFEGLGKVTA